jgi:hypothetical protein
MTDTPPRSSTQRLEALRRANEIRSARAGMKRQLRTGAVGISSLIADPPDYLSSAKVEELLRTLPHCGPVRAAKILSHCRISPTKTVIGLTPRQRKALLDHLDGDSTG